MIDQEGIVVETTPDIIVQVQPQSSCGTCKSGGGCGAGVLGGLFKSRGMRTRVRSDLDLSLGDAVTISMDEIVLLKAAIMLYLVPVALMVVFPLVGQQFIANAFNLSSDLAAIFLGLIGFISGLLLSRWSTLNIDTTERRPIVTRRAQNRTITVSIGQN